MMGESLKLSAENYPEQKFAIIDMSYGEETPENVVGVSFKEHEPSYLVGYIAGKMTETKQSWFHWWY